MHPSKIEPKTDKSSFRLEVDVVLDKPSSTIQPIFLSAKIEPNTDTSSLRVEADIVLSEKDEFFSPLQPNIRTDNLEDQANLFCDMPMEIAIEIQKTLETQKVLEAQEGSDYIVYPTLNPPSPNEKIWYRHKAEFALEEICETSEDLPQISISEDFSQTSLSKDFYTRPYRQFPNALSNIKNSKKSKFEANQLISDEDIAVEHQDSIGKLSELDIKSNEYIIDCLAKVLLENSVKDYSYDSSNLSESQYNQRLKLLLKQDFKNMLKEVIEKYDESSFAKIATEKIYLSLVFGKDLDSNDKLHRLKLLEIYKKIFNKTHHIKKQDWIDILKNYIKENSLEICPKFSDDYLWIIFQKNPKNKENFYDLAIKKTNEKIEKINLIHDEYNLSELSHIPKIDHMESDELQSDSLDEDKAKSQSLDILFKLTNEDFKIRKIYDAIKSQEHLQDSYPDTFSSSRKCYMLGKFFQIDACQFYIRKIEKHESHLPDILKKLRKILSKALYDKLLEKMHSQENIKEFKHDSFVPIKSIQKFCLDFSMDHDIDSDLEDEKLILSKKEDSPLFSIFFSKFDDEKDLYETAKQKFKLVSFDKNTPSKKVGTMKKSQPLTRISDNASRDIVNQESTNCATTAMSINRMAINNEANTSRDNVNQEGANCATAIKILNIMSAYFGKCCKL